LSDTAIFEPPLVDLFLSPDEWLGCLVVCRDESIDVTTPARKSRARSGMFSSIH
jgi:hypothetical protein